MDAAVFLALAVALGAKHAFDADHLAAVGGLLTRARDRRGSVTMSAAWAAGHMLTAAILTVLLFEFRDLLLRAWLAQMDLLVAGMLVVIGAATLAFELGLVHAHPHAHGAARHDHAHWHPLGRLRALARHEHGAMAGIGVVHGVASNDELLTLLLAGLGVTGLGGLLLGVGAFSLGVAAGMIAFSLALTAPLLATRAARVRRAVTLGAGLLSLAYGLLLFAGFGGWNPLAAAGL